MVLRLGVLADDSVDDSLENVFFRQYTVHVFNQLVRFVDLIILEVVNDQVKASLGNHIQQRRQNLEGVLASSEHDQVVAK